MDQTVLILIGGHLCTAPRAQKEADTLSALGFKVTVAGKWDDCTLAEWDLHILQTAAYTYVPVLDMRPIRFFNRFIARSEFALRQQLNKLTDPTTPRVVSYGARQLRNFALTFRADLTIAHSEGSLEIVEHLCESGGKVAVDFEDWFSADLPVEAREKNVIEGLKQLERSLLHKAWYTSCPTDSMANAMHHCFGGKKPKVILNTFPPAVACSEEKKAETPLSLVWFSQTIGAGRGLDVLFDALRQITKPVTLTLIGRCSCEMSEWIDNNRTNSHSIFIKEPIPPWEIPAELARHDVGLALEVDTIKSRNLTASNKFFQYLASGLATITTSTTGQNEVWAKETPPGLLIPIGESVALARAIELLEANLDYLANCKRNARIVRTHLCPDLTNKPVLEELFNTNSHGI